MGHMHVLTRTFAGMHAQIDYFRYFLIENTTRDMFYSDLIAINNKKVLSLTLLCS